MDDIEEKIEYRVIRSKRKTVVLEIRNQQLTVKAPYSVSDARIEDVVYAKKEWILRKLAAGEIIKQTEKTIEPLTAQEIYRLAELAKKVIPERVAYYAPLVGVSYGRITIRNQRSRWGSCSAKGNLNFNCLLMLAPQEVVDGVVVHELCHRKEMNHSQAFYAHVLRVYPAYFRCRDWLTDHGGELIKRMMK